MMDIGRTIKLMDKDCTHIQMEHNMKAIGWTISNTDKEKSIGQMVLNIREPINTVKKTVMVNFYGLTNLLTAVLLSIITFMVTVNIDGPITENTLEIG